MFEVCRDRKAASGFRRDPQDPPLGAVGGHIERAVRPDDQVADALVQLGADLTDEGLLVGAARVAAAMSKRRRM
ncbi:hypothetical protein ASE02_13760 [Phenylobacterium sp. Root700]|nr:hypothetical protein ASE02_13760 [Phenylobacterium sp. Root700]